jgi:hypothetical protein
MKNVIFTILLVVSVVWAYDAYLKSNYALIGKSNCEVVDNPWIDPGFGVPVQASSIPMPIWETCRSEGTKIHCPTKRVMESLEVDNSYTFRSGGKEFQLKWDNEAEFLPRVGISTCALAMRLSTRFDN